jgi:5,10-methylenetetrahydromethanopterin reductase
MEACAAIEEVAVLRANVDHGSMAAGRRSGSVRLIARLNTCLSDDAAAARDAVRPTVARLLGARRLRFATAELRGLTFPEEVAASVAGARYAAGIDPYLPLVPLVTDRHVDAFTLAGTVAESADHVVALFRAGIDEIIIMPFAAPGAPVHDTIRRFGTEVWPRAALSLGRDASAAGEAPR